MFKFENQRLDQENNNIESSLEQVLNVDDFQRIKDFFGNNFEFIKNIEIEIDDSKENDHYNFVLNKIFFKEKNVSLDIVIHELHHALVENKYGISQIENKVFRKFNISKDDILNMEIMANEKFSEDFKEAFNESLKIQKYLIFNDVKQKLINRGGEEEGASFMIDFLETRDTLKVLKKYREFIFSSIEQEFGKEVKEVFKILSDIKGEDEIIARAIEKENEMFGLDMMSYKNFDIKNGSLNIYRTKLDVRKYGYRDVLENRIGKKVESIKEHLELNN